MRRVGPLQLLIYSWEISKVLRRQLPHIMVSMVTNPPIQGCGTEMNRQNNDPYFHHVTEHFSAGSFFSILCQKVSKLRFTEKKIRFCPCSVSISAVPMIHGYSSELPNAFFSRGFFSAYGLDNTVGICMHQ